MKWWGILGVCMLLLGELGLFTQFAPLFQWHFHLIFFGLILLVDSLVELIKGKSLISDNFGKFLLLLVLSAVFWWIFEVINIYLSSWVMPGQGFALTWSEFLIRSLRYMTYLTLIFEFAELIRSLRLFEKYKLKHKHKISRLLIVSFIFLGFASFVLPAVWPKYFFALVWLAFFFLLDPINYLHGEPSLIKHFKDRRIGVILSLATAGLICGLLWEYFNFYNPGGWSYTIPFVGFLKIYEMPILGYLGYIPFAFSLYSMYHFFKHYMKKIEKGKRMESLLYHHR